MYNKYIYYIIILLLYYYIIIIFRKMFKNFRKIFFFKLKVYNFYCNYIVLNYLQKNNLKISKKYFSENNNI